MAWMTGNAQNYFEGTIKARSYELNEFKSPMPMVEKMLKSMNGVFSENGARDTELYIKGNKCSGFDKSASNLQTIHNLQDKKVYMILHNIKTVIDMSAFKIQQLLTTAPVPTPTGKYSEIMGYKCQLYKYEGERMTSSDPIYQQIEIYSCEEILIHPDLIPFVGANTGLPYLGMKYVVEAHSEADSLKINLYNAVETTEIIPGTVDDSIFEIPADYKIIPFEDNMKVYKAYEENTKAMGLDKKSKKKGKEADKQEKEIKFAINEDWDF